jgi:hypothetical protein
MLPGIEVRVRARDRITVQQLLAEPQHGGAETTGAL